MDHVRGSVAQLARRSGWVGAPVPKLCCCFDQIDVQERFFCTNRGARCRSLKVRASVKAILVCNRPAPPWEPRDSGLEAWPRSKRAEMEQALGDTGGSGKQALENVAPRVIIRSVAPRCASPSPPPRVGTRAHRFAVGVWGPIASVSDGDRRFPNPKHLREDPNVVQLVGFQFSLRGGAPRRASVVMHPPTWCAPKWSPNHHSFRKHGPETVARLCQFRHGRALTHFRERPR